MEEVTSRFAQWLLASAKNSPYAWSAVGLTFLIGIQAALAVLVLHGDEATVRRQLGPLRRIGVDKSNVPHQKDPITKISQDTATKKIPIDQLASVSPIKSCAPINLNQNEFPDTRQKYDGIYMIAVESNQLDDNGYTIWKSLDRQTKPAIRKIETELWIPREKADGNDPLVKAGGCIFMSFPDPAVPSWLGQLAGYTKGWIKAPQVTCILPLHLTPADVGEHKIKLRPFKIDGENGKGLDMESLPVVSDILPRLKMFLGYSDRQGLTLFKPA
ncbi:hypothetical protein FSARC_6914 [Fusarium sarcochroum]|uniref:Uncharacterized protein n=1 Tax=Fusarium sarcochroum TaxID=1208366 RepID=A0A8H4TWH7_9HYPO|nr:hypothetical protein FSARC_6914 [Fusarium sarcochroum]